MTTTHVMTPAERRCLQAAARDLHARFRGVFGEESIHVLLLDDPDSKTLEQVRLIRDQVRDRVTGLLGRLGIPA